MAERITGYDPRKQIGFLREATARDMYQKDKVKEAERASQTIDTHFILSQNPDIQNALRVYSGIKNASGETIFHYVKPYLQSNQDIRSKDAERFIVDQINLAWNKAPSELQRRYLKKNVAVKKLLKKVFKYRKNKILSHHLTTWQPLFLTHLH